MDIEIRKMNLIKNQIMKVINFFAISILLTSSLLISCKNKTVETVTEKTKRVELAKEAPKGKYAIKSGIVEYKTSMMGMDAKQILTFDDFGNKEMTEVKMDMMGNKFHTVTLNKDGFVYNYDLIKKIGTKTPLKIVKTPDIDFENMTKEMMQDMNMKKLGNEKFLGKNCEKVSIDYKKMQMKGNYLIYMGIPLKVNTDLGTMKMNLLAERIIENPSIPADKFKVPADVKISEK